MLKSARIVLLWTLLPSLLFAPPLAATGQREHVVEINGSRIFVKVTEDYNRLFMIRAECIIPRSQHVVWKVLSDYNNLKGVVPFVTTSRVLRDNDKVKILHQEGHAGIWFFKRGFSVTFRVDEVPMSYIGFDAFEGDFRTFKGSWQVIQKEEGTWVIHKVEIEPDFWVPKWALRKMAEKLMFDTIENVIHRCLQMSL